MNTKALTENEIFLIMQSIERRIKEINTTIEMHVNWLHEANNEADKMHIKEELNKQESSLTTCQEIHLTLIKELVNIAENRLYPTI